MPEGGSRPGRRTEPRLELGEARFNGVVLGGIRGEEEPGRPHRLNRAADRLPFVDGEVVQDHSVARPQRGAEPLLDIGPEGGTVQGPGQQHRRGQAVTAQARDESGRTPVAGRQAGSQPLLPSTPPA